MSLRTGRRRRESGCGEGECCEAFRADLVAPMPDSVRAVAVSTPRRSPSAPDLPTIGETLPGFEATGWQGLYAPAGTPDAIVQKISAEVRRILATPDVLATLKAAGAEPAPMRPEEFAAFTRAERAKWGEVVKSAGIRLN